MSKEEQELEQLWSYFKDSPDDIKEKRQKLTASLSRTDLGAYPSTMSISTAFDELFQCFSIGGQIKNYYRYGELSYCGKQREKLWFALRHGSFVSETQVNEQSSMKDIETAQKIQQFHKQRLLNEKAHGSSEDVWDIRETPLVNPFKED
ncbi:hypothetical protein PSN45_003227 [Yamadazyma tenuis]|uniref:Uncharacterized protein n=1 Tax=Candida tenuis (strain ATCC 10573 / BCRC 21748 / CBS 615 / JCM 9827 / NBRC 10315 / NRRL Y-1498 / VKM Y-70) TaxID=590646 RepID=G3AYY9_CANTC|nr:uncharacterized protein CANTEDRAFT_118948 [Yamadazyma tenuis ATCC 10573]EGV65967.1 hypothetical protein CANTEDRAFT_118948 [Yamadazyma tenuis ATCC 10573]WEJ95701.1 hypothetical protein PSN45_003227 [Yamadazyma tenuis]